MRLLGGGWSGGRGRVVWLDGQFQGEESIYGECMIFSRTFRP